MSKKNIINSSKNFEFFSVSTETELKLPIVDAGISAGFPSPAQDFLDNSIDLNIEYIKNPATTFFGRVKGFSMIDAGLDNGDLIIIDKSLEPSNGKIAVCHIDGDFNIRRIKIQQNKIWLVAENIDYKDIEITEANDFLIWGVVTTVIKAV